jgi:iron complex transport system ATP-binding protein
VCLEVVNLGYKYASSFALTDINLSFANHLTAIIGPNGAGKSTLIRCMANLYRYSGKIVYCAAEVSKKDHSFFRNRIGYLPQASKNDASITVFEAVLLGLINTLNMSIGKAQLKLVDETLAVFDLQPLAQRKLYELSGGQLQMVLLAQAIVKQPEILLLDEPLNNLDIHRQFALLNFVAELTKAKNMITILVMHDLNLAARYADRIAVLKNGEVYASGVPGKVITEEMLQQVYKIEGKVYTNPKGYPFIEFVDIAANYRI